MGNKEAFKLWSKFRQLSLKEFKKIYKMMGIRFDSYTGEAFYNKMLKQTIGMLEKKGLTSISEGALVVNLDAYGMPPCILRKKDEASLYATRDIAAAIYRYKRYRFEKMLYVVDMRQSLHFNQFFKVLELAGFDWAKNLIHIPFGLLKFKEEIMATRKGKIILLEDVLKKSITNVLGIIKEKNPKLKNKYAAAKAVGIGAVIFWDLSHDRLHDLDFDWEKVLDFEGETGPYAQYTYARAKSILRKAKKVNIKFNRKVKFSLLNRPEELRLIWALEQFPKSVEDSALHYKPSIIAKNILEITQAFNEFYHSCKCLSSDINNELRDARLFLVLCASITIKNGLSLLGIEAPEEM